MMNEFILSALLLCGLIIVFAPIRLAILAFLVSSHLNIHNEGGAEIDLFNSMRIVLFPCALLFRLRIYSTKLYLLGGCIGRVKIWLFFLVYSLLSILWLDDPGYYTFFKQIGYFSVYVLTFIVIYKSWVAGLITKETLIYYLMLSTILAITQTYVFGNPYGETLNWARFVSFTAKQQYAEHLLAIGTLLLAGPGYKINIVWIIVILVELFLNGSRAGMLSFALAVVIFLVYKAVTKPQKLIVKGMVISIYLSVLLSTIGVFMYPYMITVYKNSRMSEISLYIEEPDINNLGTMADRMKLWSFAIQRISDFKFNEHVFGKGLTASAKFVGTLGQHDASISANRVFHNEYIRVYYELGIVGALVFVLFILSIILVSVRLLRSWHDPTLLVFIPAIIIFLGVENVLSASGSAGGVGIVMVIAYALSRCKKKINLPKRSCKNAR